MNSSPCGGGSSCRTKDDGISWADGTGQALALAARMRGIPAHIVMPRTAPRVKRQAVEGYGGRVIECEPTLSARETTTEKVIAETGATLIPPYNYADVIAGQ